MIIFKCPLLSDRLNPLSNKSLPGQKTKYSLGFSKRKIYFTNEAATVAGHITNNLTPFLDNRSIRHTDTYTLIRLDDDDVDRMKGSKFQIKLQSGATFNIASGGWNGILMRWVHKRYSVQIHWEWYWKTIISILLGAIIAAIFDMKGYKRGYRDGLKEKIYNSGSNTKTK